MGFFSYLFTGSSGGEMAAESLPLGLESVTIKKTKSKSRKQNNKENKNGNKKKKGWSSNAKKKKKARRPSIAPKLSIFLQQRDETSQNQTVGTTSMTGTLASKSLSSNTFATKSSRPLSPEYMRLMSQKTLEKTQSTRTTKNDQRDDPSVEDHNERNHESLGQSTTVNENTFSKAITKVAINPLASQERDEADLQSKSSSNDLTILSGPGESDAALDNSSHFHEYNQSTDGDIIMSSRSAFEFDVDEGEQEQIIHIENLPKNLLDLDGPSKNNNPNTDEHVSCISSMNSSSPDYANDDESFKSAAQEEEFAEIGTDFPEFVSNRTEDSSALKNEIKKSFDQIVHEVEEAIAFSQSVYKKKNVKDEQAETKDKGAWIANGLLATVRDDSSCQNSSVASFTSDDFKEEDFQDAQSGQIKSGLEITTIEEGEEKESSSELFDSSSSPQQSQSKEEVKRSVPRMPTPYPSFRGSTASSILLCKSTPRPVLKKQVSWNDKNDICTFLPNDVNDLQKARDLISSYEKMMASLNARLSTPPVEVDGETSDADISESSSSVESLLSALSQASSTSSGSVKLIVELLREEAEKRVVQSSFNDDSERETARGAILRNTWPEVKLVDSSGSSSSFSSVYSSVSQFSQASSTGTAESVKMLMMKLQQERARQSRLLFSSSRNLKLNHDTINEHLTAHESMLANKGNINDQQSARESMLANNGNINDQQTARESMLANNWVDADLSSSSDLSSLLSASPDSSQSTTDSSDSVRYMMQTLKVEGERQIQRRKRMRDLIDSACCSRMDTQVISGQEIKH